MPVDDVVQVQFGNFSLGPWNSGAFTTPVNLTAKSMSVRLSKARGGLGNPVGPATVAVLIEDDNADYDPLNPSGTYYSKLVPDRVLRVRVSDDSFASSNVLFRGFVDDIVPRFTSQIRRTTITASDLLRYIAQQDFEDIDRDAFTQYEFTGQRASRVLTRLDVPAGFKGTVQDGTVLVAPERAQGNALVYLQELARTEKGAALWCGNDGTVNYFEHNAHLHVSAFSTSQVTFGESGTSGSFVPFLHADVVTQLGRFRRVHRATASGYTGEVFEYGTAPTDYPPTTRAQTGTKAYFDADSWAAARWWRDAWNYGLGVPAQIAVQVWPGNSDALTALADNKVDLLHRVTVKLTPPGHGAQRTYNCVVESIDHDISASRWVMTLGLSAYDALPSATGLATWSGSTAGMAPAV